MKTKMKMFKRVSAVALLGLAVLGVSSCSRQDVPAGNVGIIVNLYGDSKGVQQKEVGVGRYWISWWGEELHVFPTFNQLHIYEEPFTFQTKDSMAISAKIGVEYHVVPEKVSTVFQTYRKGVEDITTVNLRQNIADALVKHSGKYDINTLPASGKIELINSVTEEVRAKLNPVGIAIDKISWAGDLDYPRQVQDAINAKIKASQTALLRENEIAQSRAEAQKKIEEAKGEAESKVLRSKAIADSALIMAKAEAEALDIKGAAINRNPQVLQLESINKWNGELPKYLTNGSATPFIRIDPVK